jgi:capsular exopolysaccharide synthesis family protein
MSTQPIPVGGTIDFREYLATIRLRKWSILVITLLCLGLALAYTAQQTPMYSAAAKVQATNPLASFSGVNALAAPNMVTEQALVTSTLVTRCAVRILSVEASGTTVSDPTAPGTDPNNKGTTGHPGPALCDLNTLSNASPPIVVPAGLIKNIKVSGGDNSSTILQISATDKKPAVAQDIANAFANGYVAVKTLQADAAVNARRAPLQLQLNQLNAKLSGLQNQIYHVSLAGGNTSGLNAIAGRVGQSLDQVNAELIDLAPSKITPPYVVSEAPLPVAPSSPHKTLNAALGLALGLILGVGIAFLREALSDELRGRADFEDHAGVPVLAVIPRVASWRRKSEAKLFAVDQPKSVVSEAYRTLRTSILFSSMQRGLHTIMVASANAGEGKSTTAANLAVVLADSGKRVVLISADLRKPRLHRFFGLESEPGLSNALVGEATVWDALQAPQVENLRVMASGPVPARPTELLQSEGMGELLADLRDVSDFVIIDTSPILPVADALVLAPLVDGILLVADASITTRSAVTHTRELLDQVDAPLVGAVFNDYDPSRDRGGAGYYGYGYRRYGYYGEQEPAAAAPMRARGNGSALAAPENGQALHVAPEPPALERPAQPDS